MQETVSILFLTVALPIALLYGLVRSIILMRSERHD